MIDFSQVDRFATRLARKASTIEAEATDWQDDWGDKTVDEMKVRVPIGPGDPVHLRDEIAQVEPGGISFGRAYWWQFVDRGTAHMAPQPFIRPSLNRIRPRATRDALDRGVRL